MTRPTRPDHRRLTCVRTASHLFNINCLFWCQWALSHKKNPASWWTGEFDVSNLIGLPLMLWLCDVAPMSPHSTMTRTHKHTHFAINKNFFIISLSHENVPHMLLRSICATCTMALFLCCIDGGWLWHIGTVNPINITHLRNDVKFSHTKISYGWMGSWITDECVHCSVFTVHVYFLACIHLMNLQCQYSVLVSLTFASGLCGVWRCHWIPKFCASAKLTTIHFKCQPNFTQLFLSFFLSE